MRKSSHSARRQPSQARARATVDALLEAAAEVFEEHGLDGGTTERIVARAGVSVGSMYQYFPNKNALLSALGERTCADAAASQRAWLDWLRAEDPRLEDGLRAFVAWLVAAHAVRPRLRCLLFEERPIPEPISAELHSLHAATLEGLTAWLTGKVRRPRVTALMLHRVVPGLVHPFVLHPHPDLPVSVAVEEILTLTLAYLGAVAVDLEASCAQA